MREAGQSAAFRLAAEAAENAVRNRDADFADT
jgi:hypothetical protein